MKKALSLCTAAIALQCHAHTPPAETATPDTLPDIKLRDINVVAHVNHLSEVAKVDLAVNPVKSS